MLLPPRFLCKLHRSAVPSSSKYQRILSYLLSAVFSHSIGSKLAQINSGSFGERQQEGTSRVSLTAMARVMGSRITRSQSRQASTELDHLIPSAFKGKRESLLLESGGNEPGTV